MTKINRRDLIQLLAPISVGVFIFGCNGKIIEKEVEEEETVIEIEEELSTNGVIFLTPKDDEFNIYNKPFNLNAPKIPKIIALCSSTEGIANAIKYANKNKLKVGIKSGGHCFENFSTIEGGLTVNLSLLKAIEIDENSEYAWVESGCLLKDTYDILLPKGKLIPAGSCATVGIGGLTLGGGYGFFSRKYGLTCDHIISLEFVNNQGIISTLTDKDELMWALKGAGNGHFGVVSRFKFKLRKAPEFFSRWRFKAYNLDVDRYKVLLKEWLQLTATLPETVFAAFVLNKKTAVFLFTDFEDQIASSDLANFAAICDKIDEKKTLSTTVALKNYYGIQNSLYFKNSSAGYFNEWADFELFIDELAEKVINSKGLIYQINTLGGAIGNKEFEQHSSYPHRSFNYLTELQAYWEQDGKGAELMVQNRQILELLTAKGVTRQYANYPSLDFINPVESYYGAANLQRLKDLKLKYDKENIFNRLQGL